MTDEVNQDQRLAAAVREVDRLMTAGRWTEASILAQSLLSAAQKAANRAHYRKHPLPVTFESES